MKRVKEYKITINVRNNDDLTKVVRAVHISSNKAGHKGSVTIFVNGKESTEMPPKPEAEEPVVQNQSQTDPDPQGPAEQPSGPSGSPMVDPGSRNQAPEVQTTVTKKPQAKKAAKKAAKSAKGKK